MVLPPRHHLGNVGLGGAVFKRQSISTCTDLCTAAGNVLSTSSDPYSFCSKEYFDGYQKCMNCYAQFPYFDATFFNSMKNSFDTIVDSCNSLGRPISNPITIPPLANGAATGSYGQGAATPPPGVVLPTGNSLPTGVTAGKPTSTNPSAAGANNNKDTTEAAGPPIGAIVGGIVGGVAVIAGIILAIFFLRKRNRNASGSAGAALIPEGPSDFHQAQITPFQYPAPQSTGTPPPPQMQQQYAMGPYGASQFDAASSHGHLPMQQQQYNMHPDAAMQQRVGYAGGFVGGLAVQDNHASTYAASSYGGASSEASYPQPPLSPGPFSSGSSNIDSHVLLSPTGTSTGASQLFHSPSVSSAHSSAPLVLPPQHSSTSKHTQAQAPPPIPFDCPPAYDDAPAPADQPEMPAQASSSSTQALSAAEMELISQRVATLINNGGGPAGPPKKS